MKLIVYKQSWAMTEGVLEMADASAAKVYCSEGFIEIYRMLGRSSARRPCQAGCAQTTAEAGKLERLYRTASIITFGGGANEIQRDIISAAGCGCPGPAVEPGIRGMEFGFSQEQQEVRELARKILSEQVSAASLAAYDEFRSPRFDTALWQQLLSAGLPAWRWSSVTAAWVWFMELALFIEEVGRSIAPLPAIATAYRHAPIQQFRQRGHEGGDSAGGGNGELLLTAALAEHLNDDPAEPR